MAKAPNIIGRIILGSSAELVFSIYTRSGQSYASVRKFQTTGRYTGPTKSGIMLRLDCLEEVMSELKRFRKKISQFREGEVGRVKKSRDSEMVIQVVESSSGSGVYRLDIREHIDSDTYQGWTKKGIRFDFDKLDKVLELFGQQAALLSNVDPSGTELFCSGNKDESGKRSNGTNSNMSTLGLDDVVSQVVPHGPKKFPDDFYRTPKTGKKVELPPEPLELGPRHSGKQAIVSNLGFVYETSNPAVAKFLYYAHLNGQQNVWLPPKPIDVFKAVKQYEKYLRGLHKSLLEAYYRGTGHKYTAEQLVRQAFRFLHLPWLEDRGLS